MPNTPGNRPVLDEGDRAFYGVDAATAPEMLPPGMMSRGYNTRFRSKRVRGRYMTRPTGLLMVDFYPYGTTFPWLTVPTTFTGSVTGTTLTITAGDFGGIAMPATFTLQGYTHLRFDSGRVMELTTLPETGLISTFSDLGGGQVRVGMLLGNSLVEGALVTIYDSTNYNGSYTATNVTGTTFDIAATYVAEGAGARWQTATVEVQNEAFHAWAASGDFWFVKNDSAIAEQMSVINEIQPASNSNQTAIETGLFSNPNGEEYGLVATQTSVWGFRDYERPFEVTVPGGIPDGRCDFVQCFDKVLLCRGDDLPVLEWDGQAASDFIDVTATSSGDYTEPIPNARMGIFVKDRLFVVSGRDTLYHSDIGDYTRYKEMESGFRVNKGTADSINCLYPYGDEAFLVGMSRSIYLVYNIYGDLSDMSVKLISANVGIAGRHSICGTGDDVWFMDVSGHIWPLSRVDETRQEVGGTPVSWPIEPMLEELGLQLPSDVRMIGHADYVYVAFPGVDATVETMSSGRQLMKPNYVAVYDTVTNLWAGVDDYAYLDLTGWLVTRYGSREQLLFCGKYGTIYQYASQSGEEAWTAKTRAYVKEPGVEEQGTQLAVVMQTQAAQVTVYSERDGVGTQEKLIASQTRSRTKSLAHGKADWDPSNVNLDFDSPDREDYGIFPADAIDGNGIRLYGASDGLNTQLQQSYTEVVDLRHWNERIQIQITNDNPDSLCSVSAVVVSSVAAGDAYGSR